MTIPLLQQIKEYLRYLEIEKNASQMTVKSYREDIEGWIEYTYTLYDGNLPRIEQIGVPELRGYLAAMGEAAYAKTTIVRRLAALRSFYRFAQRQGWCSENPAKLLRNPKLGKPLPLFLTESEVSLLLNAPRTDRWQDVRNRAILEVLYSAGLRVSELTGMNLNDLMLDEGMVLIRGKGRKERYGFLGRYAVEALNRWFLRRPEISERKRIPGEENAVFLSPTGTRLTPRSVERMLDKYIAAAGLSSRVSPHTLRHSFATHLLNAGADIRSIQELLGHKNLVTTQIYTHLNSASMKDIYLKAHPRGRNPEPAGE